MARAFIALGSNIAPADNVRNALRLLSEHARIAAISTVYRTRPIARPEQDDYYNCVIEIETDTPPQDLRGRVLRTIEDRLGRTRSEDKSAARTIDLDLILYDDLVLDTADLRLPDPEIASRPFLAIPLSELAPHLALPGSAIRVSEAADSLPRGDMTPLAWYTEQLRRDIAHGHSES